MTDEVPNYFQLSFNWPLSVTIFSVLLQVLSSSRQL